MTAVTEVPAAADARPAGFWGLVRALIRNWWTWHLHGYRKAAPKMLAYSDGEPFEVTVTTIRPGSSLERMIEERHAEEDAAAED